MQSVFPTWLWIPVTLWAAFAQTLRNAAQRHLTRELGTLGATSVRFFYGLPFALMWLLAVLLATHAPMPSLNVAFWAWVSAASLGQIAGTALLIQVMSERNFALGVAYSKTETVQVALIAMLFLGERLSWIAVIAVLVATFGVVLISTSNDAHPLRALANGLKARSAWLGVGAGAGFAIAAVGFRGAALALGETNYLIAAAVALVSAQILQSIVMAAWFQLREPSTFRKILAAWRGSLAAGFMGAAASAGWFTAMTIEPVAHVKTLGMIELLFSLVISRRVFKEALRPIEWIGVLVLGAGLSLLVLES